VGGRGTFLPRGALVGRIPYLIDVCWMIHIKYTIYIIHIYTYTQFGSMYLSSCNMYLALVQTRAYIHAQGLQEQCLITHNVCVLHVMQHSNSDSSETWRILAYYRCMLIRACYPACKQWWLLSARWCPTASRVFGICRYRPAVVFHCISSVFACNTIIHHI